MLVSPIVGKIGMVQEGMGIAESDMGLKELLAKDVVQDVDVFHSLSTLHRRVMRFEKALTALSEDFAKGV